MSILPLPRASRVTKIKVKQLELNYLQGLSKLSFHIKELQTYCLNNHQKKYLRNRIMKQEPNDFELLLRKALLKFYTISKSTQPFLIVVPPLVDLNTVSKDCAPKFPTKVYQPSCSTESLEHFFSENKFHLCVHPHHLIGQSFSGVQNIMVVGLESLLSATAFEKEVQPDHLLGLFNPNMDLLCFYLKSLWLPGLH